MYWLQQGAALQMAEVAAAPAGRAPGAGSYRATSHAHGNRYALTHLFNDPDDDYWMWDLRYEQLVLRSCATHPRPCSVTAFPIASPGRDPAAATAADLTVRLHGGSDTDAPIDHRATVVLNGVELGTAEWAGMAPFVATFEVPPSVLNDGDNTLEVNGASSGVAAQPSVFYINDFELEYSRRFTARQNRLTFTSGGRTAVTVSGLTGAAALVLDVHNPQAPTVLTGVAIGGAAGGRDVSFATKADGRHYVVTTIEAARRPAAVIADVPSHLRSRAHRVEHLIITTADMAEAAQVLAEHRRAQGLASMVVDIEDIYDEFSDGIKTADALWSFLHYAHSHWALAPRYVVLAGAGSIDYRNYLGVSEALIPTLLTPTPQGLYPSDNRLADVDGNDGLGEFAIGRLPVINAAELSAVITKIIAYENSTGGWQRDVLMVADRPEADSYFIEDTQAVAARVANSHSMGALPLDSPHLDSPYLDSPYLDSPYLDSPYLDSLPLDSLAADEARERLRASLHQGLAFVNFLGHGGLGALGTPYRLTSEAIANLDNGERLPIVTAFSRLAGQFTFQGIESVAETLLLLPDRGAAAVWSPVGLSFNPQAWLLSEGFYNATFTDGELILGEAILSAQRHYAQAAGSERYLLNVYNLLGDPATVMK